MENGGNAERGFLELIALESVVGQRANAGSHFIVDVVRILEEFRGRLVGKLAAGIQKAQIVLVAAGDLGDFLFESHAREQVGDAVLDGQILVFVGRLLSEHRGGSDCKNEKRFCEFHRGIHRKKERHLISQTCEAGLAS